MSYFKVALISLRGGSYDAISAAVNVGQCGQSTFYLSDDIIHEYTRICKLKSFTFSQRAVKTASSARSGSGFRWGGWRIHSETWVGCIVCSTTASNCSQSRSRSVSARNVVLTAAIILAASYLRR